MGSYPAFLSNGTTNAIFHSWGNSPVAIERLITCIRSGSNSGIYCLTNLVGKGSRAQLVVFDLMTNLRISSSETTSCHIHWRIQSTLQVAWQTHSLWHLTWPMRSPFETPVDYPIFISSRNRLCWVVQWTCDLWWQSLKWESCHRLTGGHSGVLAASKCSATFPRLQPSTVGWHDRATVWQSDSVSRVIFEGTNEKCQYGGTEDNR